VARYHPKSCKVCGIQASEEEPISARGYCLKHGLERMERNNREISPQAPDYGEFAENWRRRIVEKFGGVIPDREAV
jgi:hypothetical protein